MRATARGFLQRHLAMYCWVYIERWRNVYGEWWMGNYSRTLISMARYCSSAFMMGLGYDCMLP